MSQRRYLEFELRGHPGNVDTVLNRFNAGLSNTQNNLRRTQRDLGLMDRQLLAIGTTLRYAFAGSIVFGITGLVSRLGEFESTLGRIEARSAQIRDGNLVTMGGRIEEIGNQAMKTAVQFGIATEDVQRYQDRFWSSFDPPGGAQARIRSMQGFVQQIAMLRRVLGPEAGDPEALAGGIAGFVHGIPGGSRNITGSTRRVANLIGYTTWRSPVITGGDVTRDIGRLGSAQTAMRLTPEQLFAVYGAASMRGGSPAVIGRGVTQLLSAELLKPQTEQQKAAFSQMGLPTDPNMLRQMGGWNVLMKMMRAVGGTRVSRQQAQILGTTEDPEEAIAAAGVQGPNITLASQAFGRMESFRQFLNLLSLGPNALDEWLRSLKQATRNNFLAQQDAIVGRRTWQQEFVEARRVIGLQAVRGLAWPMRELVSDPTSFIAQEAAGHPRATQGVMAGGATVAATLALNRLTGGRILRGAGRFARGLNFLGGAAREAASQALTLEAMPNLITGGEQLGGRANPLWVMIHPASWYVSSTGGAPWMNPAMQTPKGGPGRLARWGRRVIGAGGWGARIGGAAALAVPPLAAEAWEQLYGDDPEVPPGHPLLERYQVPQASGFGWAGRRGTSAAGAKIAGAFAQGNITADIAEARLRGLERRGGRQAVEVSGQASVDVTVRMVDAQGRPITTEKAKGVPVRLWSANQAPTSRGRSRQRGGSR